MPTAPQQTEGLQKTATRFAAITRRSRLALLGTMTARVAIACFLLPIALLPKVAYSTETTCRASDFDMAIDEAGSKLRDFNAKAKPLLQDKIAQLKGRADNGTNEARVLERLHDAKVSEFDRRANTLLTKIDTLGQTSEGTETPDCGKLEELKTASRELLAVMQKKSDYVLAKIDTEIAKANPAVAKKKVATKKDLETAERKKTPPTTSSDTKDWNTATKRERDDFVALQRQDGAVAAVQPAAPLKALDGFQPEREKGYSIDEIRSATRGFFGNISTGLASIIEYSFKNWGRPSGYILGREGGGAFLAGLRYGSGQLYLREGGTRKIYWHGPSIGYDFGASGDRTMFLVYRLDDPNGLYRQFTGVDGSAYLVGGVGLTVLKGGRTIMAPIRSGLGLRLGANIGYLRFTARPTWNPF